MSVTYKDDGDLFIVELDRCLMVPIVRTVEEEKTRGEELFSDTVRRAQRLGGLDVSINAVWYDVSKLYGVDILDGDDPVSAAATTNQGEVVLANATRFGNPNPDQFYAAQNKDLTWKFGFGNLPRDQNIRTGISGLCPLIINGLKYGTGNKYKSGVPEGAPVTGAPGAKYEPYLIQRNNNRYASLAGTKYPSGTGKAGFGITATGRGYVIVQAHLIQGGGVTFDVFRDKFISLGCTNALACDGSDSVFMYRGGAFVVDSAIRVSHNKIETMTCGLGFKENK